MDLQAAARNNQAAWVERGDAACTASPKLNHLRDRAEEIQIGTNVDPGKLIAFRAQDPPQIVSTFSVRSVASDAKSAYRETYTKGIWGPRREAFEKIVGGLCTTVYGTLDLPSCPGDDKYGVYRLTYPAAGAECPPVVLPHNSALVYGNDSEGNEEVLTLEVAAWEQGSDVAVHVLREELLTQPVENWPLILPRQADEDLVEVVVTNGARPLDDVTTYRVSKSIFEHMLVGNGDTLRALAGATAHVDAVVSLAQALAAEDEKGQIHLEEVN